MSAGRHFTPEEANEALATVRPLAEQMVEHYRELEACQERRDALQQKIAGNGGGLEREELVAAEEELRAQAGELADAIEAIHELGVLVKDPSSGLVDFPALAGSREVLLCWQLGEEAVEFWHSLEGGFAGRRTLPLEDDFR
jgi:hypothetical protein